MKTNKELMMEEKLYCSFGDKELTRINIKTRHLLDLFNNTKYIDFKKRARIAKKLFGKVGENICINKPFRCDYGINIEIGDNFYANFDCIILDVNKVIIGNNVLFAPRVSIYTAGHPIDKDVRNKMLEFGKQVIIGNDVWIGGNVIINPGVKIGNNVVIGSGSVVVKDIPSNVVAAGNPCKVIREITDLDKEYWSKLNDEYDREILK